MSKAEKIIAYIMQQLSLIGENFGWQIGRVGANWENGYMKCNQDSKAHFRKDEIKREIEKIMEEHIVEDNKMIDQFPESAKKVISEKKIGMVKKCIYEKCFLGECDGCTFFDEWDETDGEYFCAIRDKNGNIPYYTEWDIESALKEKVE